MSKFEEMMFMLSMISGEDSSKAIEDSEKRGQRDLCNNPKLPVTLGNYQLVPNKISMFGISQLSADTMPIFRANIKNWLRDMYNSLGIQILSEDDHFYEVKLPDGWEIRPDEHPMWSALYDNNNEKVLSIFFKQDFIFKEAKTYLNEDYKG